MPFSRRTFLKLGGLTITAGGFVGGFLSSCRGRREPLLRNLTKGVEPLVEKDFQDRREKARQLMAAHQIRGLFLTPGSDLKYFTGVEWGRSERAFGALLTIKGEPVWICPAFEEQRAKERIPEGQKILAWKEHESPYSLIAYAMRDAGYRTGPMALNPTAQQFVYSGLRRDAAGLRILDGAPVTEGCRARKSPKEISYLDLAATITKLAYHEAFKQISAGMSPQELAGAIREAHGQLGTSGGAMVLFGPNSAFPHGTRNLHNLEKGDTILVDGGCTVEGYHSDVTRTLVLGKPGDKQHQVWDTVKKAQKAVFEAVRPGILCEELDGIARKIIVDAGYGPDYAYFTHRLGHGIGLDGHEYPYLVSRNQLRLRPGMTFSNEPGIYIPGEFGVRLEDCFAVTQTGVRILGGMEAASIDVPFSHIGAEQQRLLSL